MNAFHTGGLSDATITARFNDSNHDVNIRLDNFRFWGRGRIIPELANGISIDATVQPEVSVSRRGYFESDENSEWDVEGSFYGPQWQEVEGVFSLDRPQSTIIDVLGAKRQ